MGIELQLRSYYAITTTQHKIKYQFENFDINF